MKIAVGLSGGVDSSVAALILKNQGHDVIALFMQNWHDTTGTLYGDCPWKDDRAIAELVARKLDIPFHFVDLSSEYSKRVVDYMFSEYQKGRTPNPDVLCNREIKFEVFLKSALDLGAEYVATGHYCRKETIIDSSGSETYRLLAGKDPNKDQSYFLCQLTQKQLSKALFPIGDLLKPQVREMAAMADLPSADKKDSQGICFVGKVDLPVFLQQKLQTKCGDVIEVFSSFFDDKTKSDYNYSGYENIDDEFLKSASNPVKYTKESGKRIGEHQGAHFYTIGQRKGLNIGGHKDPLFIISTDVNENLIFVGEGQNHKGLFRKALFIDSKEIHWIRTDLEMAIGEVREYLLRIRYRQPLQKAKLFMKSEGLYIVFNEPQRGITPGQFAAWYENDELIGSGVIMS
ncbi:MAG: tRNA 2-thiouridine(34) synthase MnmA [Bacteroidetes bacterium GWE2_39_28]|nr:MAG: tRNA 2-thiouridine(34) synthase MnmA [Bacteroidetes bacterium GWE2_39_28]OFY15186.1 MAG: tRNA 2-thiouridine(34) synthase MnmA [Bacteroidetes bacterium GWF2_39_10]OFZ09190.1 MAG: tRNA 2-thiouridine(34) synthase MnmA [Bacteroidetes bacterium RIFOXYB2_FULL_39_7]OFZ09795.1 MAG: tRNA 2-thiouridine(34) synthase MnmA [Bacteroidetes bacterium RIFOXYC2_FULL_39_11]HCT93810.1 tRNA 2-thiouridine(34) synthase MnmA [Rikenellaceae bacterium]